VSVTQLRSPNYNRTLDDYYNSQSFQPTSNPEADIRAYDLHNSGKIKLSKEKLEMLEEAFKAASPIYGPYAVERYIKENGIRVIEYSDRPMQVEFLNSILRGSVSEYLRTGIPWQVTMAQAAMETGWGQDTPIDKYTGINSNNIFGIKYGGSPSDNSALFVRSWTKEHIFDKDLSKWETEHARWAQNGEQLKNTGERDGKNKLIIQVIQPFRTFASRDEAIIEHSHTLNNGYYEDAMQYKDDPYKFLESIAPIYASDSDYYDNGVSIMDKYLQWDGKNR
jgi:flagellum-specific peptidoglycan hydrolase FlgJ